MTDAAADAAGHDAGDGGHDAANLEMPDGSHDTADAGLPGGHDVDAGLPGGHEAEFPGGHDAADPAAVAVNVPGPHDAGHDEAAASTDVELPPGPDGGHDEAAADTNVDLPGAAATGHDEAAMTADINLPGEGGHDEAGAAAPGRPRIAQGAVAVAGDAGYGAGDTGEAVREAPLSPEVIEDQEKIEELTQTRTWTDATGQFKFEGAFIEYSRGDVQLQRADSDQTITLEMKKLSDADQQFIRDGLRAQARERKREEQLRIRDLRQSIIGEDRQRQNQGR
jgi:hypothetical protein